MSTSPIKQRYGAYAYRQKLPLKATLVLTERCHLRCQQCYLVENPREELSTQEIFSVLEQLAQAGTLNILFTGGEPLLRTDIYEILQHARQLGFINTINTTATPCNQERSHKLVESGMHRASVSIYAAESELHDQVTRVPGSFEKTIAGVQNLRDLGVHVELKFLQMRSNQDQLTQAKALAESLGAQFFVDFQLTACHDGRREPLALQLQEESMVQLLRKLAQEDPSNTRFFAPKARDPHTSTCSAGHTRIVIGTNGEVYPCIDFLQPLGNVRHQPLQEIWTHQPAQSVRQLKRFSDPVCRVCPDLSFCHRCPGSSLVDTGDPTRPSTNTCLLARARRRAYEAHPTSTSTTSSPLQSSPLPVPSVSPPTTAALSSSGCGDCSSGALQRELARFFQAPPIFDPSARALQNERKVTTNET